MAANGILPVMHLLTPVLRDYAWGTTTDIPAFLGLEPSGGPIAEAWWGAHEDAPSVVSCKDGPVGLDAWITANPVACMGSEALEQWGPRLPFLLKILAVAKPLSIQVHPRAALARAGVAREQDLPADRPRNFRDPYPKPEMVVALTPMRLLVGIRPVADVRADLAQLGTQGAADLAATLINGTVAKTDIADYIRLALNRAADDDTLMALARVGGQAPDGTSLRASADALASFPGDAGALVALALNVVDLAPGEAAVTDAGVLHSYQSGLGIEIMANSDNVARAGLTPKHVDVPLLLEFATTRPTANEWPSVHTHGAAVTLTSQAQEFALTTIVDGEATLPAGPRIVLVADGAATVTAPESELELTRGQAAFVHHSAGAVTVKASGTAMVAHLPPRS